MRKKETVDRQISRKGLDRGRIKGGRDAFERGENSERRGKKE